MSDKATTEEIKDIVGLAMSIYTSDEFVRSIAKLYRKLYLEFIDSGFSESEAIQLLCALKLGGGLK